MFSGKKEDSELLDDNINRLLEFGDKPFTPEPYNLVNISSPPGSFGVTSGSIRVVNWSFFWDFFQTYSGWNLEFRSKVGDPWVNYTSYIEFDRIRYSGYEKQIINFTAPDTGYYRLNHTINTVINDYEFNSSEHEYTLNASIPDSNDTYFVFYNWSDVVHSSWDSYMVYSHGLDSNQYFYLQLDIVGTKISKNAFISIDPNFGSELDAEVVVDIRDYIRGTSFTSPANGSVSNISAWIVTGGGWKGSYKHAVYNDSTKALVGYTGVGSSNTDGWQTLDIVGSCNVLSGQDYYLVSWGKQDTKTCGLGYTTTDATAAYDSETFNGFPDPWAETSDAGNYLYSIYASYTLNDPSATNPSPSVGATEVGFNPNFKVTVNDANGDTITTSWYLQNITSDVWELFASNSSNNATLYQNSSQTNITSYNVQYNWSVNVSDGTFYDNNTFYFTTEMMTPEIRANNPVNGSTDVSLTPTCNITVWDNSSDAESLTVRWYENTSGLTETGIVGDNTTSGSGTSTIEDRIVFGRYTTPSGITNLTSITVLISGDVDDSYLIKGVVYDWSTPFTLLPNGITEEKNIVLTGSDQWIILNFSTPPEPNATEDILIGVACNVSSVAAINFRYDATGSYNTYYEIITYPTIPPSIASLNSIDDSSIPHIYVNYSYFNPDGFSLQQTNNSVSSGDSVEWVYNNATVNNQMYWWRVEVNNSQNSNSSWYSFTTVDSGIALQELLSGYFTGGNDSQLSQLISGWFTGNNISSSQQLISGFFCGGNDSQISQHTSGYFSGGNVTVNTQIISGWFSGNNISSNQYLLSGWFSGKNNTQISEYTQGYFSGGNITTNTEIVTGWYSGGNVSTVQHLISGWFSGNNISDNQYLLDGWFSGGNTIGLQQLISGFFSGGNESELSQTISGWFSGNNISNNEQLISGWYSGGNDSQLAQHTFGYFTGGNTSVSALQQLISGWFSGGNLSQLSYFTSGWFSGNNISANQQLIGGWFSGRNNSLLSQHTSGWFGGGNASVSALQQLISGWFSGGNLSQLSQFTQGWFSGNNISSNQYLLSGWFSGGNTITLSQLVSGWFSGGTAGISQLISGWFSGGNASVGVLQQLTVGWFSGGNVTWYNITITDEFPSDSSLNAPLQPTVYATVTTLDGNTMNMSIFYGSQGSENNLLVTHSNISNGTYSASFYQASGRSTDYYWRIMLDNGVQWINETYGFTTEGYNTPLMPDRLGLAVVGIIFGCLGVVAMFMISNRRKKKKDEEEYYIFFDEEE